MIKAVLQPKTDVDVLRERLIARTRNDDTIEVVVKGDLRFTHLRSCLAVVNTVAFARSCTLRYSGEREFRPPPLDARYSHEPNITHAKPKKPQKDRRQT